MKLYTIDNQFIEEVIYLPKNFTGIVEYSSGTKEWIVNGKIHRIDGPAWEGVDGSKVWYVNGELHRLDGPAIEYSNGIKLWHVDNKEYTEEQCKLLHSIMKLKGLI